MNAVTENQTSLEQTKLKQHVATLWQHVWKSSTVVVDPVLEPAVIESLADRSCDPGPRY